MSDEAIRAEGISAGYAEREVITDLSFSLNRGEVLAIIGPNGSGKTTLLRALLGLMPIKSGNLSFFGKPRLAPKEAERLIAYIPQRLEFDRSFPISLREMLILSTPNADIEKYLDMLDLRGLLDRRVGELSGGQMQRALLAYAIIKEPGLLVMDEPTSWVDVRGADCIICIIEEFRRKGIAIAVVSHDFCSLQPVATHVLGLGAEGHFFAAAGSDGLDDKMAGMFGSKHHSGPCVINNVTWAKNRTDGKSCGH